MKAVTCAALLLLLVSTATATLMVSRFGPDGNPRGEWNFDGAEFGYPLLLADIGAKVEFIKFDPYTGDLAKKPVETVHVPFDELDSIVKLEAIKIERWELLKALCDGRSYTFSAVDRVDQTKYLEFARVWFDSETVALNNWVHVIEACKLPDFQGEEGINEGVWRLQ